MRLELIVWAGVALLLIAAEMVAPGVFMLWMGLAAVGVFLALLFLPDIPVVWQAIGFVLLSVALIGVYRQFFRSREPVSDQPLLNRRGEQLVGQIHVLEQAIVNGQGRLKIGDAFWAAQGQDMAQGTRVRIVAVQSMSLQVVAAD
jgi:membrane protein implicated in regulation of membrane protease activity